MLKYSEKLKDPRWQKMRLEILQRDNFTCRYCFDDKTTLHVHHKSYKYNNDPWDYPEENFITLCENCHEKEATRKIYEIKIQEKLNLLSADSLDCLNELIESLEDYCPSPVLIQDIFLSLSNFIKRQKEIKSNYELIEFIKFLDRLNYVIK
jgi:hypothetical protein